MSYGRLRDERQVRAAIEEQERRRRQAQQEDVRIENGRRLILRSPNGNFWSITVDDAGALTATDLGPTL